MSSAAGWRGACPGAARGGTHSNSICYFGGNRLFRPSPSWCFRKNSSSAVLRVSVKVALRAAVEAHRRGWSRGECGHVHVCVFAWIFIRLTLSVLEMDSAQIHVVFRLVVLKVYVFNGQEYVSACPAHLAGLCAGQRTWLSSERWTSGSAFIAVREESREESGI